MKTIEKDIILICKGWYNKSNYDSVIDALKAYQAEKCKVRVENITFGDIIHFALLPVAKIYFSTHHWTEMFEDRYLKDINWKFNNESTDSMEYAYNLLIRQICDLQIKEVKGTETKTFIDLSDYSTDEDII